MTHCLYTIFILLNNIINYNKGKTGLKFYTDLQIKYSSSIEIPDFLKSRVINKNDAGYLKTFFYYYNIRSFSEITLDIINDYGKVNVSQFFSVCTLLGLYGVNFIGRSANKYSPNSRNLTCLIQTIPSVESIYNVSLFNNNFKNIEFKIVDYLNSINVKTLFQLKGINLSVLLDKLNLFDINIYELSKALNTDVINLCFDDPIPDFYSTDYCPLNENLDHAVNNAELNNLTITETESKKKNIEKKYKVIPVDNTDLSLRATNILKRYKINTVYELLTTNINDIRNFRNLGGKIFNEIYDLIKSFGDYEEFQSDDYNENNEYDLEKKEFNDNKLHPIDYRVLELKIGNISSLSCSTIEKMNEINIQTVNEYIEFRKASVKLLKNSFIPAIKELNEELFNYGIEEHKSYYPIDPKMPDKYFTLLRELPFDNEIMLIFNKYNLRNIGQLLTIFPDKFIVDDELILKPNIFKIIDDITRYLNNLGIDNFPIKLSPFQLSELNQLTEEEILEQDYLNIILYKIKHLFEDLSQKEIQVIEARYGINGTDKQTLDDLGKVFGVTRERIRQIELRGISKLRKNYTYVNQDINHHILSLFNKLGYIIKINIKDDQKKYNKIINYILKDTNADFKFDFERGLLLRSNVSIKELFVKISEDILVQENKNLHLPEIKEFFMRTIMIIFKTDDEKAIENAHKVCNILFEEYLDNNFIKFDNNVYRLKTYESTTKERNERIIHLFKELYSNGVHLPINDDKLLENNLKELIDNLYSQEKTSLRTLSDTIIKGNQNVILWDKGTYIHINNVSPDWSLVDYSIEKIIKTFDKNIPRFKPQKIFNDEPEKFINGGIPNPIALLGLIRYKGHERFEYRVREIIDKNSHESACMTLEMFENYILQQGCWTKKKSLIKHFCEDMGWTKMQLELLYGRSSKILADGREYIHVDNLKINSDKLNEIADKIVELLNKEDVNTGIHLRKVQALYPASWFGIIEKNTSYFLIGRLLSNIDNMDFIVEKNTYVKLKDTSNVNEVETISQSKILEKWIFEQSLTQKYVTESQIKEYCIQNHLNSSNIKILLKNTSVLECYDSCYAHYDIVGYSDDIIDNLMEIIQTTADLSYQNNTPLIKFESILDQSKDELPELQENYDWTESLLRDILLKANNVDVFYRSLILLDNPFNVEDLDDISAFLIIENFEENICSFSELDKLLAKESICEYKNLHFQRQKLFFEGSSIELVDDGKNVVISKIGRDKYLND